MAQEVVEIATGIFRTSSIATICVDADERSIRLRKKKQTLNQYWRIQSTLTPHQINTILNH